MAQDTGRFVHTHAMAFLSYCHTRLNNKLRIRLCASFSRVNCQLKQVGVTRFNMDGSGSNHSASTSNSPMMNRDIQQPFNQGTYAHM